ncbi:MAG: argininosuccinate lyase [Thermodesulfobacteriota bacterium]
MKVTKMWTGRFQESAHELLQEYTDSLECDKKFSTQDLECSRAHARMLAKQGILLKDELEQILQGLERIEQEIQEGSFPWRRELEDVHMNIEQRLTEIIGEVGQKLHTGRSRNDQVAADFRLFVSQHTWAWSEEILELIHVLLNRAEEHVRTVMPGYTHLQPAQPVSLAQHLLAYVQMFRRDYERLQDSQKRTRVCPLGAAALAGTTYDLDPEYTAGQLGFAQAFENSMDAVSDRDFVLESLFAGSVIMTHLSRLCEEIILWANPGFGFVQLPDALSTGSSIMPQKKNPDLAELMRGRTGRTFGDLLGMLTVLKAQPLAYNRDLQEDKPLFLRTDEIVYASLRVMAELVRDVGFVEQNMLRAVQQGYLNATEFADYLVQKGLPFRQAHFVTGKAVAHAESRGLPLEALSLQELQFFSSLVESDVYQVLEYEAAVSRRSQPGGTGYASVQKQLQKVREFLAQCRQKNGGSV